jgi:CheY-like chemotaxis protein/tetratricopeptide (TPR) repeat protein
MNLAKGLPHRLNNPSLSLDERARLRCKLAKQLEELGSYEGACEALGEFWPRAGERPALEGLNQLAAAEVLLRTGVLTGWVGSVKQIEGAQERAKDFISGSMTIFETLDEQKKVAEAQTELAFCYWREGSFDEARLWLREALKRLVDTNSEVRAVALLRRAIIERAAKRLNDALRLFIEAAPEFDKCRNDVLKAKFHNEFGNTLTYLITAEHRQDYADRAFMEYTAASCHFEKAGHTRYQAYVENNLGFLLGIVGKFPEAHEYLDRAQALFTTLKDTGPLAQVDNTRAQVLLAEGHVGEAEKFSRSAVQVLERGGEQSLLAEALTTRGIALGRLGRWDGALAALRRASEVAEQAGDQESAGLATLSIVEELGSQLSAEELGATFERAAGLLDGSQNLATFKRLCACARRVLFLTQAAQSPPDWRGFSFKEAVRRYESHLIERALRDAGGLVTRAAQLLGLKNHQSLIYVLKSRHKRLLKERAPATPRKRSIVRLRGAERTPHCRAARPALILHVEDNPLISDAVRDTLELEGLAVEVCADGGDALGRIGGDAPYDLLLVDQDLPGACGTEIVRRARSLAHRRRMPIVVFSAVDCEAEALASGADAFLRKPNDVALVAETVARLLAGK